jgi:hypothetical protein
MSLIGGLRIDIKETDKTLKFYPSLIPAILDRSKTSTWRLFDDKDLTVGDRVDFIDKVAGKHFATAELTRVRTTTLGRLTEEDKAEHESFASDAEMHKKFEEYYKRPIGSDTTVKIVHFKIDRRS